MTHKNKLKDDRFELDSGHTHPNHRVETEKSSYDMKQGFDIRRNVSFLTDSVKIIETDDVMSH